MFGFDLGYSKQKSDSSSGLRGTPQFAPFAELFGHNASQSSKMANEFAKSAPGSFRGQSAAQLTDTNTATGLPNSFTNTLTSATNDMYSKASAGGAMRGQNTPESTGGVVGSATQNLGQFLAPYIVDWQKYMQSFPEMLKSSRLGFMQNQVTSMAPGLGSTSSYSGMSVNGGAQVGGKGSPFG